MNITIILSGGYGARFDSDTPKQYHKLYGHDVIAFPFTAAQQSQLCECIIVAAHEPYIRYLNNTYGAECCSGGETHNETVSNALRYVGGKYPKCQNILFADSVRPLVTSEIIDKYFEHLKDFDGVVTVQKITDSLGKYSEQFVDRKGYYLIQKPEAFRFAKLYEVFDANRDTTAITQQMPSDAKIEYSFSLRNNVKITYPEDLRIAETLLSFKHDARLSGGSYDICGNTRGRFRRKDAQAGFTETISTARK